MLRSILFPKPMREFPAQRWVRISVRTCHLLSMGYLLGGAALGVPLQELTFGLWGTLISGGVFAAMELYASGVWLLQLKGQAELAKLVLMGAALLTSGSPMPYLIIAVIIGGFSSHMPGRYRYYSVFHGRVIKE